MLETIKADVDQQLSRVRGLLAEATSASPLADFLEIESVAAATAVWESLSIGRRREMVRLLMDITLLRAPRGTYDLDPDTVVITPRRKGRAASAGSQ